MSRGTLLLAAFIAVLIVAVVRIVGPFFYSLVRRARMHGPAPYSAGGGGTAAGWGVSLLWALFEKNREERYEYMRETERDLTEGEEEPEEDPLPRRVPAHLDAGPGEAPGDPWTEPVVSDDGRHWWSGRRWVESERFAPAGAQWSDDRSQWWDGAEWRWAPGEFPDRSSLPQRVDWSRGRGDVTKPESAPWMERRRGHLLGRTQPLPRATPERSDPPPDHLRD